VGTLADFYTSCNALTNRDQRRWSAGAAYRAYEYVQQGYTAAAARALVLAAPQYANGLTAAGLTASFNALTPPAPAATLITVANSWTGVATPGTDVVITTGGVPSGQVMYAAIADRGTNADTITPPGGWTLVLEQVRGSVGKLGVYRKVAGASEPASYTFTCSANSTNAGAIVALTGASQITPEDVAAVGVTATVATGLHTTPSVTTASAGAMVLRIVTTAVGTLPLSWTWPGAQTEVVDFNSVATGAGGISIASEIDANPGAAGAVDATFAQSSSTTYAAVTVAVRPA
jgi:hypothetical protein